MSQEYDVDKKTVFETEGWKIEVVDGKGSLSVIAGTEWGHVADFGGCRPARALLELLEAYLEGEK